MSLLDPRLEILQRYADGGATAGDVAALEAALHTDAEFRAVCAEYLALDAALDDLLAVRPDEALPGNANIACPGPWAFTRHSMWRAAIAAACVVLLVGAAWFWQARRDVARLAVVEKTTEIKTPAIIARLATFDGEVQIGRAGRRVTVQRDLPLQSGDEIRTAGTASVRIQYAGEVTWVELAGDTVLEFDETPSGKRLNLRRGRFKADVVPQPAGRPMVCRTPQADALVLGTVFTLAAWSDQTFLNVEHGVVRLSQGDGSAQDVKAGEAARAVLGAPVRKVPRLGNYPPWLGKEPPAVERIPLPWITDKGLINLPPGNTVTFDFETKPKWTFVNGAYWQPPNSSMPGHLCLTGMGSGNSGYKAVSPYVSVGTNEVISVNGKARFFNRARLWVQYYLSDETPSCFGHLNVKPFATSDAPEFVPFRIEFTLPSYEDLRFISIVLYCQHHDGTQPQEGDTILVDELHISRGRGAP